MKKMKNEQAVGCMRKAWVVYDELRPLCKPESCPCHILPWVCGKKNCVRGVSQLRKCKSVGYTCHWIGCSWLKKSNPKDKRQKWQEQVKPQCLRSRLCCVRDYPFGSEVHRTILSISRLFNAQRNKPQTGKPRGVNSQKPTSAVEAYENLAQTTISVKHYYRDLAKVQESMDVRHIPCHHEYLSLA